MTEEHAEFDIVLWGATGFTGRPAAEKLVARIGSRGDLRWAIGGRNQTNPECVGSKLGPAMADLPIITGDSHDMASLEALPPNALWDTREEVSQIAGRTRSVGATEGIGKSAVPGGKGTLMRFRTSRSALVVGVMTVLLSLAVPANAEEVSDPLLENLVTPLGLAVGNDGSIYVAQSFAGTLTQVRKGTESNLFEDAGVVTGVEANGRGNLSYLLNAELVVRTPNGKTKTLANLFDYEAANNPDESNSYGFQELSDECAAQVPDFVGGGYPLPGIVDSNPYAVELMPNGDRVVADAAGNTLVLVTSGGAVSTLAVLPPRPATINAATAGAFGLPECTIGETFNFDFVPTDVELGPDGMLYVTSLPGGPEGESPLGPLGAVFKVDPSTGAVTEVATGFAGATDLAVTKNGTIYVTELFGNQVSMVSGGGPVPVASMPEPVAIEYAKGHLYVASGVFGGPGQVVMLKP